jgi:hypothetical protein
MTDDEAMGESMHMLWAQGVKQKIDEFGHAVIGVFSTEDAPGPPFTYTIGMFEKYGFEILVFGIPHQFAGMILNDIGDMLRDGGKFDLNTPDDRWANMPVKFMETDDTAHGFVVQADNYYEQKVRVLQLVLPDKNGKFFDEAGYDHEYMSHRQPICTTTQHLSQLH